MKYFLDTEFIESEAGVQLVSIGMICEDGRKFYAISNEFDSGKADKWVVDNVLVKLDRGIAWNSESQIRDRVVDFIGADKEPQFFAYYADYDWVVFCRLFGRMIDLPKTFPMYCMDLKQMMKERRLNDEWMNKFVPKTDEHDALSDAKWNAELYDAIMQKGKLPVIKDEALINEDYIERLKEWILRNQDKYFIDPAYDASSWCDYEDFNKTVSRRSLCLPNEVMLIDRLWKGKHCYVICKVTPKRKGKDLFKVIGVDELQRSSWRNGYFLLPDLNEPKYNEAL